ncbi:MAG: uroporphyrinogen-III C-methyltransferase [Euryarchaeota archaeon]|nr:uroporphyrinogen-III C-methyltransferase [Euryarchaeota archaeon]
MHSNGTVYLVGSGPGDPELMTVAALHLVKEADVIVYDQLPGPAILASLPDFAERIDVGKYAGDHTLSQEEINRLLIDYASQGKIVVRLKGGDPYLFGRGGEEAIELRKAGIPFEVVPGITSAIAVPAYAGIPVTHRDHASILTVITGHEQKKGESMVDWGWLAQSKGTIVVLMGVTTLGEYIPKLMRHGMGKETPVAIIERGTREDQVVTTGTLDTIVGIARERGVKAPAIVVIGDVVRLREELSDYVAD